MTVTVFFTIDNEYSSETVKAKTVKEAVAKVAENHPTAEIYETCIKSDWDFIK